MEPLAEQLADPLALTDAFTYKQRCGRCGTEQPEELPIGQH